MKCLSLWQPWATLMAIGAKRNETRSWETSYRGPLVIHAAKHYPNMLDIFNSPDGEAFVKVLSESAHCPVGTIASGAEVVGLGGLPRGVLLCVVDLVDCVRITPENTPDDWKELAFGDYTPGRFMWKTENVRCFCELIPFAGHQRLFNVPDELVREAA